ncbi:MAG TPA: class I SAM-dependent methyltransferase [Vicinamibacterales bacterium]|jgi:O-antigen chain-terminating methyltransferase|nr:class I SAM-dependent methyltransferase [Vicinamibacterales bacterium]
MKSANTIPGGTDRLERERDEAHRRYHEAFAALDRAVVEGVSAPAEQLATFQSLLVQFLQQITPYIDSKVRVVEQSAADAAMTATMAQRAAVAAERATQSAAPTRAAQPVARAATDAGSPLFGAADAIYVGFEDCFRGTEDEIRSRQSDYVALFQGASDVLDAGCGRGEFLSLLREAGVTARGVDLNIEMVEACRSRGLTADHGDVVEYIEGLPDESIGGLFAAQVVEHLPPDRLLRFLRAAGRALRPGSRLVVETINPSCWVAFFESFIKDLTHVRPLHPDTLKFLVIAAGFTDVETRFRTPIPEGDRLRRVASMPAPSAGSEARRLYDLIEAFNLNMERLNDRIFTHLDYAIVARLA